MVQIALSAETFSMSRFYGRYTDSRRLHALWGFAKRKDVRLNATFTLPLYCICDDRKWTSRVLLFVLNKIGAAADIPH